MSRGLAALATVAFATVGLVCPREATAQSQQSIPADIVAVLMQTGVMSTSDTPEIRIGPPPADFPVAVLPSGAQPVVTATSRTRGVTVIARVAGLDNEKMTAHQRALRASGWLFPGPSRRGFVPALTSTTVTVCKGQNFIALAAYTSPEGQSYVRATQTQDTRRPCAVSPAMSMSNIEVPELRPTATGRFVGISGGGGMDSMTSTGRLIGGPPIGDVAKHYESQLTAAGWKVTDRNVTATMHTIRFAVSGANGDDATAFLTVTQLPTSEDLDLFLRAVLNARDPRMNTTAPSSTTTLRPLN